jgi:hypothetical protein
VTNLSWSLLLLTGLNIGLAIRRIFTLGSPQGEFLRFLTVCILIVTCLVVLEYVLYCMDQSKKRNLTFPNARNTIVATEKSSSPLLPRGHHLKGGHSTQFLNILNHSLQVGVKRVL